MKVFYLLAITVIVGLLLFTSSLAQHNDKTLKNRKWKNEPLQIFDLKVKGRKVKFNEKFFDNDDWFRNLAVGVKNISNKTIMYVDVALIFPPNEGAAQDAPSRDHLIYGHYLPLPGETPTFHPDQPPVKPGDSVLLVLKDYEGTREFLNRTGKSQSVKEIEIEISEVIFDDATKWIAGKLFRRDPKNPKRWLPQSGSSNSVKYNEPLKFFEKTSFDFPLCSFQIIFSKSV